MVKRHSKLKASLTVEASFVIPLCFFAMYTLFYFFILMRTEFNIFQGLVSISDHVYAYGPEQAYADNLNLGNYFLEKLNVGDSEIIKNISQKGGEILNKGINLQLMKGYLKEYFEKTGITLASVEGGVDGIDLSSSRIMLDSSEVVIIARYTFNFPGNMFGLGKKRVVTRLKLNSFYGSAWEKVRSHDATEYVYLAETGDVYHRDAACTYIKLKLKRVNPLEISNLRSEDGCIYYPCEECGGKMPVKEVYILNFGSRYHTDMYCSKIKRNVTKVTISEAEELGKTPCTKCGGD